MDATEICSRSLILLGASPLNSLDNDASDAAAICRAVYPTLRDSILGSNSWGFGRKRVELTRDATTPVAGGGWRYSFQLPNDRLNAGAFAIFLSEAQEEPPYAEWEIFGDRLVTDQPRVWAEYPRPVNEAEFPAYFIDFLCAALCARIGYAITDQQNVTEHWHDVAHGTDPDTVGGLELSAQIADAQARPARSFDVRGNYDLVEVRFGG